MAKAYIGADNVSKLVKAMYMGVDGVARKVTKAYRGVDGVAKLVYSGEEGYLYGGTSTFVYTATDTTLGVSPGTDYTLTEDRYVLQVEKYDTIPLYVYIDGELVATATTEGEQTISLDGWATTLASRGTITVTVTSEGTYGLGEQDLYQFWDYTGTGKNMVDTTLYGLMTSATLSDNVIKIWNHPFDRLTDSDFLSIPSRGLITIGDSAFSGTAVDLSGAPHLYLKSFTIPRTVTSIGTSAFTLSGLTSINIPSGVTSIGDSAFAITSLTSINIPSSVSSIGRFCFYSTTDLTEITFKHGVSDPLSLPVAGEDDGAFKTTTTDPVATNVYHNGNATVLNYDWASDSRAVTFIPL